MIESSNPLENTGLVSISIPFLNHERVLSETRESVLDVAKKKQCDIKPAPAEELV